MSSANTFNRANNNETNSGNHKQNHHELPNESDDSQLSDEDDSLLRLSQQAQHRKLSQSQLVNDEPLEPMDPIVTANNSGDIDYDEDFSNDPIVEEEEDDEEEEGEEEEEEDDDDDSVHNDDNDHPDEDEELEMLETADFLRQLMQARRISEMNSGSGDNNNNNTNNNQNASNANEEQPREGELDDARAEFLRAIGALSGARRGESSNAARTEEARGGSDNNDHGSGGRNAPTGFVDVMQRLMGGGIMFGGGLQEGENIGALVDNLEQRGDTFIILESLNQISENLLMMNGLTAERLIPSNRLARNLVNIMDDPTLEEELELHLVACRCLYNFLEVNQDFIHDALNNNAVPALCNKLLEIKYIDLTEQALQTLEMISRDTISHNSIIVNNGLTACLQYLDFLTVHAQRKCLSIVSNSCTNISVSNFNKIKEAFTSITEVVRAHNDQNVVENAWITIARIIECFKNKPDYLNELFSGKELFFKELVNVILVSCNKSSNTSAESEQVALSYSSCLSLIKSLIILSSVSIEVSKILLSDCDIGSMIVKALNKFARSRSSKSNEAAKGNDEATISIEALLAAPKELVSQFLTLIGYLLPIIYTPAKALYLKPDFEDYEEKENINHKRVELCTEIIPDDFWKFVNEVWTLSIYSIQATTDVDIRRRGFINLYRIVSSINEPQLGQIKHHELISGLLASVVNQYQPQVLQGLKSMADSRKQEEDVDMRTSDFEDFDDARDQLSSEERQYDESDEEMDGGTSENDESQENEENDEGEEEEEDADDDEEDDADDDDDDGEDDFPVVTNRPEDLKSLNSTMLMLSALEILNVLLKKAASVYLQAFEREGLMNDVTSILKSSSFLRKGSRTKSAQNHFSASFANKYIDVEYTKEYEFRSSIKDVYFKIKSAASEIKKEYNNEKMSQSSELSEHMRLLYFVKEILSDIKTTKSFTYDEWLQVWEQFKFALQGASDKVHVSSFELISSGVITQLTNLLTSNDSDHVFESSPCYRAFIHSFFNDDCSDAKLLVHQLLEALTRSESFEIVSAGSHNHHSASSRDQQQATLMANQIKLKLNLEGDLGDLKMPTNLQNMVVSVHAIATFKSILSFLKQRLQFMEQLTNIGSNRASSNETEEGKKFDFSLEFLINGEVIPLETTIYGAIYRSAQTKPDEIVDPKKIWTNLHQITFRKVSNEVSNEDVFNNYNSNVDDSELTIYDKTTIGVLQLLKVLFKMNTFVHHGGKPSVPVKDFINWKLTAKLNRQLEEPLVVASGTLPGWSIHLTKQFPFIFPLATRIFFFQSTSFGYSRLIHQWQLRTNQNYEDNRGNDNANNNSAYNQRPQLGRPNRHKVRISRKMMLQSALKVLGMYGSTPGILEIEYFDEVGSGLGPTLEFYSTVSKEFSKRKLKLWRDDNRYDGDAEGYVENKHGLFPSPMDKQQVNNENGKKILYFFSSLGKFIARALLDSRIIDFNFNPIFLKLVQFLNQKNTSSQSQPLNQKLMKKIVSLQNLKLVDPELAKSLQHLQKYAKVFENVPPEQRNFVEIDGAKLGDLGIYFELPGYPKYELIPNGSDTLVQADNLDLYITKVLENTLFTGVIHQTKAFMDGFSKVFPISSLMIFSPQELVELFGNCEEDWSFDALSSAIVANHGYSKDSPEIKELINILIDFDLEEKRQFLQFLTGSPKLPIGGFKALRPELTVVRKHAEDGLKDDDYLPSVMTCANYLKIPKYSSKEVMREKLLQAVKEGAGAFLLS
ncbi:Ufd4 protein [Candida orthopsilosis Co 90-125]|uniref:HECT-type E3 ubiquitin transferase n=1 Tax=Candida orthopsilosis (strain 90-125) TaxID=1136231 RepID=H8WW84_CANO9|nr:Ufd4 protein [Candida orthopsilosis Co 90-125]CCG20708.1 Ufd4 protein [Candida orthopsilosis Co 90-125]